MNKFFAFSLLMLQNFIATAVHAHLTGTVTVDAKANIFAIEDSTSLNVAENTTDGILPQTISLPSLTGEFLIFKSITGEVSCCNGAPNTFNGPDGSAYELTSTDINSYNGISGIKDDRIMFLAGVFIDSAEFLNANLAPPRLDFMGNHGLSEIVPKLNQVFFIGDGLTETESGITQRFLIPENATQLVLGFTDSHTSGLPGAYGDNVGKLTVAFEVSNKQECMATYFEDGRLHIPCLKVPIPFGKAQIYDTDMELIPLTNPFQFLLKNAETVE